MALVRDAIFKRSPKLTSLIKQEREKLNLKGVNKITVCFDPFRDDTSEIRKFTSLLHARAPTRTNPKCVIKTEILRDRSEQTITFDVTDGKQIIFKCANLKCLEIYKLMNQHITPLAPEEVEVSATPLKAMQKGSKTK